MKTHVISKKETEKILDILHKNWINVSIPKIKNIKVFEIENDKSILVIDSVIGISISNGLVLPFLGKPDILEKFPSIVVDSGSVKFICNGAKILRPGIIRFDDFVKN